MEQQAEPAPCAADWFDRLPVTTVAIGALLPGDTPRRSGEDLRHVNLLAEISGELPPIVVHRPTMRVIDGMHRLRAAIRRGDQTIGVRFFDGSADEGFVYAVEANIKHGLPLSLADRQAAAERIMHTYPELSDRAVAARCGLSPKTVSAIRRRSRDSGLRVERRVGLDGRIRPLNTAQGRRAARDYIAGCPDAPLREVADNAGISFATARDVRERMRRGEDPVPERLRLVDTDHQAQHGKTVDAPRPDKNAILRQLSRDPSVRMNESGRLLIRWLASRAIDPADWAGIRAVIPAHCAPAVMQFAELCATSWQEFARELRRDIDRTT
ncbi:ParB/RepB/Spo0J family partition protein [Nocardia iowensis]